MTKWATWMPCGDNSRAMLCARPRSANLPIANGADCGIALDAGGGAGEEDRAVPVGQHAPRRLLGDQEAAEGADRDRLLDLGRHQIDERHRARARWHCRRRRRARRLALDSAEQARDLIGIGGVAGKGLGAGLGAERGELVDLARRERDVHAFAREEPRQRRAEAAPAPTISAVLYFGISMAAGSSICRRNRLLLRDVALPVKSRAYRGARATIPLCI